MRKPWQGEFPIDSAEDMDDAAVAILHRAVFGGGSGSGRHMMLCSGRHELMCENRTDNETGYCDACETALDM